MPDKIWILNMDDFLFKQKASYVLKKHSLKYIQILKQNDIAIVSPLVEKDKDFVDYTAKIKRFTNKDWLLSPATQNENESLIEAIARDKALLSKIKKLCANNHVMIPLMYSESFADLSQKAGNNLLNNSIAVSKANDKLLFKKICKKFNITAIQPVIKSDKDGNTKILKFVNFKETYLLRRPFSAGGYGNTKGKLFDLLKKMRNYQKDGEFYIEPFKEIYKTLGTLCMLKDDGIHFAGIDCQIVHKEAWEGCYFPFKKLDKNILAEVKEKTMQLATYYYEKGVRGQINFDWAIRIKNGKLLVRVLECNSRYNGFGLCLRLGSSIYDIPKENLHFYLDTNIPLPKRLDTKKAIALIEKINKQFDFKGGTVLVSSVKDGHAGFCFMAENEKNVNQLRNAFKKAISEIPAKTKEAKAKPTKTVKVKVAKSKTKASKVAKTENGNKAAKKAVKKATSSKKKTVKNKTEK